MEVKLIELRDSATFMPMMAIKLRNRDEAEFYLLRRAGYGAEQIGGRDGDVEPYIIFMKLDGVEAQYDPYAWSSKARTVPIAHQWLIEHWNDVKSGDVVDVQFILGETPAPKRSEAHGKGDEEWR